MKFWLLHFRRWWRYVIYSECPGCHSDHPEIWQCRVCNFWEGNTTEYLKGMKDWWKNFVNLKTK